jgi:hypothetical protein
MAILTATSPLDGTICDGVHQWRRSTCIGAIGQSSAPILIDKVRPSKIGVGKKWHNYQKLDIVRVYPGTNNNTVIIPSEAVLEKN